MMIIFDPHTPIASHISASGPVRTFPNTMRDYGNGFGWNERKVYYNLHARILSIAKQLNCIPPHINGAGHRLQRINTTQTYHEINLLTSIELNSNINITWHCIMYLALP